MILFLLYELGVRAVVYNVAAKDRGGERAVYFFRVYVL